MRRAQRIDLGPISSSETSAALRETVESGFRSITQPGLHRLTGISQGYPYLIQLAGYYAWRHCSTKTIELADVEAIEQRVIKRLGTQVHQPALRGLSDTDRAYLQAMALDIGPSSTKVIADRLGKKLSYQSMYRHRLLDQEIIVSTERGFVDFELPYMREYLSSTLM